jgi:hypothetical protein
MSNVLNHQFVSAVADSGDASLVQPSNWNAGHKFSGGTHGNVLMRDTGDATFGASWLPSQAAVATITTTGTVNNYALGAIGTLRCNNATLLTLTGIAAGIDGQLLFIESVGAGQVDLSPQDSGSTAANRLLNFATIGKTSLAPNSGVALYKYDATTQRWRLMHHIQGAWLTRAFSAGNYVGSGAMTWTVDAGDVLGERFELKGRTATLFVALQTTTVGGTPSASLNIMIPNGWTCAATEGYQAVRGYDNGTMFTLGTAICGGTTVQIFKDLNGTAWAAATNATHVYGTFSFEVQ